MACSVREFVIVINIVSGAIKNSSVSDDSSSEMMELEDSALIADPQLENNIRRLREEERLLLEQQAAMEAAGNVDDIAALEHQDLLRLNHLKQQELQKQLAHFAQRQARANANANAGSSLLAIEGPRERSIEPLDHGERTQRVCRSDLNERIDRCERPDRGELRRRTCNVRVNHLHVASCAEALETDV